MQRVHITVKLSQDANWRTKTQTGQSEMPSFELQYPLQKYSRKKDGEKFLWVHFAVVFAAHAVSTDVIAVVR